MVRRVNYSGLVIAGIGFFLTRFTVTLALSDDPVRFYFAGIMPLVLGLGLAAFGVALTVADVDATTVRTTALWCVIGTVTMFIFAVLILLGSSSVGSLDVTAALSRSYLSNFLIGGSIGGTLTGLYAARNRRQRDELRRQANKLVILNRMLRHEVLNAITAIQGYASLDSSHDVAAEDVITDRSKTIERTIDDVKYLTRRAGRQAFRGARIDLSDCLRTSVDEVHDRYPAANISLSDVPDECAVHADAQLAQVFIHLLENAIVHTDDTSPSIEVLQTSTSVRVNVSDTGSGLPESQQSLLETGDIGEFDDPKTGFGLNLVRLFVDGYDGEIETDVSDAGTTVGIILPKPAQRRDGVGPTVRDLGDLRPAIPHLLVALGAALIAGVFYGIASEALGGTIAGIGVFYGTADPVVGWLTHEFHSVVFGFVFIGLVSLASDRWATGISAFVGIGIGWALLLWVGAAGIVAPLWLQLLGISVSVPNLSFELLVSHLVWGISLGLLTATGYRYLLPVLTEWTEAWTP